MTRILIVGSGGHGKVVADILLIQGGTIAGFLDDDRTTWGTEVFGLPVLGAIDTFADHSPSGVIVAVGSNRARQAIAARLEARRVRWVSAIHPGAMVARSASLGQGAVIAAGAVLNPDCQVGAHAIINIGATVDHDCGVGAFAHLAPGCHLAGGVRVGKGAHIGVGVAVKRGCVIGDWATIDAGAAVDRDIPAQVAARGVPATWATPSDHATPTSEADERVDDEQ